MTLPRLKVIISRERENGPLKAFVEQLAADGPVRGSNLLKKQKIREIEAAKIYVQYIVFPEAKLDWVLEEGGVQTE